MCVFVRTLLLLLVLWRFNSQPLYWLCDFAIQLCFVYDCCVSFFFLLSSHRTDSSIVLASARSLYGTKFKSKWTIFLWIFLLRLCYLKSTRPSLPRHGCNANCSMLELWTVDLVELLRSPPWPTRVTAQWDKTKKESRWDDDDDCMAVALNANVYRCLTAIAPPCTWLAGRGNNTHFLANFGNRAIHWNGMTASTNK